jgi:group I intron endonuclease
MTCGIYILKFKGTNKVYVGQSVNIKTRYLQHINSMKAKRSSDKLINAYITYGIPTLEIILECQSSELDDAETEAIEIFDSFNNGFNSLETAEEMPKWKNQLKGEDGPSAIYSNEDILQAIRLMCDPNITLVKISEITNINYATIRKISQGVNHLWVQEKHPELWNKMTLVRDERILNNTKNRSELLKDKFSAKSQGIVYPQVVCPSGEVYTIDNLSDFCRTHELQRPNFRKVLNGSRISHKGWKVFK